jgi:hypothetical protein
MGIHMLLKKIMLLVTLYTFSIFSYGQGLDRFVKNWVAKNNVNKWAICSATSIEIRAATINSASQNMASKLNMMDSAMKAVRADFVAKGTSDLTLDKLQQAAFDQNKNKPAQTKGELFNLCLDSLDEAAKQ